MATVAAPPLNLASEALQDLIVKSLKQPHVEVKPIADDVSESSEELSPVSLVTSDAQTSNHLYVEAVNLRDALRKNLRLAETNGDEMLGKTRLAVKQVDKANTDKRRAESARDEAEKKQKEAEKKQKEAERKLNDAKVDIDALTKQRNRAFEAREAALVERNKAEQDRTDAETRLKAIEARLNADEDFKRLQHEYMELRSLLKDKDEEIKKKDEEIKKKDEQIKNLKDQISALDKDFKDLQRQYMELRALLKLRDEEIKKKDEVIKKKDEDLKKKEAELASTKSELAKTKEELAKIKEELAKIKEELSKYTPNPGPNRGGLWIKDIFWGSKRITDSRVYNQVLDDALRQERTKVDTTTLFHGDNAGTKEYKWMIVWYGLQKKNGDWDIQLPVWGYEDRELQIIALPSK